MPNTTAYSPCIEDTHRHALRTRYTHIHARDCRAKLMIFFDLTITPLQKYTKTHQYSLTFAHIHSHAPCFQILTRHLSPKPTLLPIPPDMHKIPNQFSIDPHHLTIHPSNHPSHHTYHTSLRLPRLARRFAIPSDCL